MKPIDPQSCLEVMTDTAPRYANAKAERRAVVGWPEYEITSDGQIYRIKAACGTRPGKALKPTLLAHGYLKVGLCRDSKRTEYLVHRLVAEAFIGAIPNGMDVCHWDGAKDNNSVKNLRIDTRAGNVADNVRLDRHNRGERCGSNKYSELKVRALKVRLLAGEKVGMLAAETGIPRPTLYNIRDGQSWKWLNV